MISPGPGKVMHALIRIPRKFFDDHQERDLPTPQVIRQTRRHYWISPTDPHFPELLADAQFYAGEGTDADDWKRRAQELLAAIERNAP